MGSNRELAFQREKAITEELERNLKGKWPSVLAAVVPELRSAIEAGHRRHVQCPFHQAGRMVRPEDYDFRLRNNFDETGGCHCTCSPDLGNGFRVIMHAHRCSFMEARQKVINALGGRITTTHIRAVERPMQDPSEAARKDADLRRKISRYWDEAVPLTHPDAEPVRNWLRTRGLGDTPLPVLNLRCHPALDYYTRSKNGPTSIGVFPAMLAMLRRPDGRTSTIHRTYLEPDGSGKARAVVDAGMDARKEYPYPSTHPTVGGAVRFDDEEHPALNIGEGVESMLAARLLAPLPTWSVLNKELLRLVELPDHIRVVTVWADRDRSLGGQAAALELVDRLRAEGRRAVAFLPPFSVPDGEKSVDWNDVVKSQGVQVMRRNLQFLQWKRRLMKVLEEVACEGTLRRAAR